MDVSGFLPVFGWGCFGGILAESLSWYQLRESPHLPAYAKSAFYWGITLLFIIIGGILACLYGTVKVNGILAVNIGASAPIIIASLGSTPAKPAQNATMGAELKTKEKLSLREFLSGR
jgi:hypothetical protein